MCSLDWKSLVQCPLFVSEMPRFLGSQSGGHFEQISQMMLYIPRCLKTLNNRKNITRWIDSGGEEDIPSSGNNLCKPTEMWSWMVGEEDEGEKKRLRYEECSMPAGAWLLPGDEESHEGFKAQVTFLEINLWRPFCWECVGRTEEKKTNMEAIEKVQVVDRAMMRKQKSHVHLKRRVQRT